MKTPLLTRIFVTTLLLPNLVHVEALANPPTAPQPAAPAARPAAPVRVTTRWTPITRPSNMASAVRIIGFADVRPLSSYFGAPRSSVTLDQLAAFSPDFENVLLANQLIGFADDPARFRTYFTANQARLLSQRSSMGADVSLQGFFVQVYVAFKVAQTQAHDSPQVFLRWLDEHLGNPLLRQISSSTFTIVVGVGTFVTGIVSGALIAGPAAGSVGAFLEPMVRPIREKMAVLGSRIFSRPGLWLNRMLFNGGPAAQGALHNVEAAKGEVQQARDFIASFGVYEATATDVNRNNQLFRESWNQAILVWNRTMPDAYRAGRNLQADALVLRPRSFAADTTGFLTGAEVAVTAVHNELTLIERQRAGFGTPERTNEVRSAGDAFTRAVTQLFDAENNPGTTQEQKDAAKAQVETTRARLIDVGASPEQIIRITSLQTNARAFYRQAATSLAGHFIHDIQYAEFNRAMPEQFYNSYLRLRQGFMLDYFHAVFRTEITTLLNSIGIRLATTEGALREAVRTAPAAEPRQRRRGNRSTAPAEAPAATPRRSRTASVVDAVVSRVRGGGAAPAGELSRAEPATPAARAAESAGRAARR